MSSRNAFTTNYIYHGDVVRSLEEKLKPLGWNVRSTGENSQQPATHVVGMIKNVDYFNNDLEKTLKQILLTVKEMYDYKGELSLVFIGDECPVITFITTSDKKHVFNV